MAKRKLLALPEDGPQAHERETKSTFPPARPRAPIAEVAGEVAGHAAAEEMAAALSTAEREGRMARRLPIDQIDRRHIIRDRMVHDEEEMSALMTSLSDRGQQMPIEVMREGSGYALISGARRLEALTRLGETHVMAFVRTPADAAEAHVAMVEENEIRAALSFYERANLAVAAVGAGVFADEATAIATLFARATATKRSKITRFVILRQKLGTALSFPTAIPEKLGLALAKAIDADARVARRIVDALRKTPPADAAAERRVIERALAGGKAGGAVPSGIVLKTGQGGAVLTGTGVDAAFLADLEAWLSMRRTR